MRIEAWKCEADGKIFEHKESYKKHLAKLARARRAVKAKPLREATEAKWWNDNFYNNVKSPAQLQAAILYHADEIGKRALDRYWLADRCKGYPVVFEFVKFDLKYKESVSNSHSCPVNGVQNWGGDVKLPDGTPAPRGYPGLQGWLEYRTVSSTGYTNLSGSNLWEGTRPSLRHSGLRVR